MSKFLAPFIVLFALLAGQLVAQQIRIVENVTIVRDGRTVGRYGQSSTTQPTVQTSVCYNDTLAYPLHKSSNLRVVNMNSANSAAAFGQYYDAPQPITISKLRFYAYKLNPAGGLASNVIVELYNARPDSLPMGAPIRTANILVDTNFHQGSLSALEKVVTFSSPATVSGGYVVVVRNSSVNPIGLVIDDYLAEDGDGEWLANAQISGIWRHAYQLNIAGTPFDGDILLDPIVSYSLSANFQTNPTCIASPGIATFTNTSSPILRNRMYNYAAFLNRTGHSVTWQFGDSTGEQRQVTSIDTTHYYAAGGSYNVHLRDTIYGWSTITAADTMIQLGEAPEANFVHTTTALNAHFINQSGAGANAFYWSFGDGSTSTQVSPYHSFTTAGTYNVCLYSSNWCGTDSVCKTVVVTCPVPTAAFSASANLLAITFTDWSTGGVNAWEWNFGDGVTSTQQNPTHTYMTPGNYLVHLRTYNACGMDSSWYWLNTICPMPAAAFAHSTNGLQVNFSNLSSAIQGWVSWDFGDGSNSAQQNPIHNYVNPGIYTACLTVSNPCGADTFCETVTVSTVGIASTLDQQFEVYPNPVASTLHIHAQLPSQDQVQLRVLDLLGAEIKRIDLGMLQSSDLMLDVQDLAVGSYLLQFHTTEGMVVRRISVLR